MHKSVLITGNIDDDDLPVRTERLVICSPLELGDTTTIIIMIVKMERIPVGALPGS